MFTFCASRFTYLLTAERTAKIWGKKMETVVGGFRYLGRRRWEEEKGGRTKG